MSVAASTQKAEKAPSSKASKGTTKEKSDPKKTSPAKDAEVKPATKMQAKADTKAAATPVVESKETKQETKPASSPSPSVKPAHEFGAKFGRASIGKGTVSIPAGVDRNALSVSQADKLFCCKRFPAVLRISNVSGDQQALPGMEVATELSGIFEVKGFAVRKTAITFTLNLPYEEKDANAIPVVANHDGQLRITGPAEDIPDDE